MIGKIKTYIGAKGYGFIVDSDEKEYFFHEDDFKSSTSHIAKTNIVEFDIMNTDNGLRATNIVKVGLGEKNPYVNLLNMIEKYILDNTTDSEERNYRLRDLNKTREYIANLKDMPNEKDN
jgi:cold shock CspA family protein